MNDNTVSGRIREIVRNADLEARDYRISVQELVEAAYPLFLKQWTDEDNYRYRLRVIARNVLNSEGLYSIGGGEYYSLQGDDAALKASILENLKEQIHAYVKALNKKKNAPEIAGQYFFEIDEDGDIQIKEAG